MFALRVLGQALVVTRAPRWLPSNEHWYSGLMPYRYLLPAQLALLAVMVVATFDVYRGQGLFAADWSTGAAAPLAVLSWVYFAAMVVRYVLTMTLRPEFKVVQTHHPDLAPHGPGGCAMGVRRLPLGVTVCDKPCCPIGVDANVVKASSPVVVVADEV